jgi:signal transduction histidine kinase
MTTPLGEGAATAGGGAAPRPAPGTRLIFLAIPLVLLLAAIGLVLAWRNYQAQRARATDETTLLAASTAADTDRLLGAQIGLLEAVATSPSFHSEDEGRVADYLRDLVSEHPTILGAVWSDPSGRLRAAALPTEETSIADRDYFQAVRLSGNPFVSAASVDATGRAGFQVAVPTRGLGGTFTGILSARYSLTELEQTITSARTREVGEVLVVDRLGQMIVDGRNGGVVQDISGSALYRRVREQGLATLVEERGLRGQDNRLVAIAPVPAGDWLIFVDRPAESAFAAARRTFLAEAMALAGVAVAGTGGLLWTGRRLNHAAAEREQLLTAEREARAEAEEAVQLRDQVLAGVSHDLKNPLTTIRGVAQVMRRRISRSSDPVDPQIVEGLEKIDGATTRMASMMDELLDAARLQMGQPLELRREPADLMLLVRRAVELHRQTTDRHRIRVEECEDDLTGDWDRGRLERVLDNLLSNAIKYSPQGGQITLRLRRESSPDGDQAVLEVEDRGIGVPTDEMPRIFDRFYRARNAGRIAGTGIGLAGAYQIVEQHGGTLSAARAPAGGSIFTLTLPLEEIPAEDAEAESDEAEPDAALAAVERQA